MACARTFLPPAERRLMALSFRFSRSLAWLVVLAVVPLAGVQCAHAQQQMFPTLKDAMPSIMTIGVASTEVVPDIAMISLGVDTERPNAADAARENARAAQVLVSEIKALGIEARDIRTVSISLSPVYDETSGASGRTKQTLRGYLAHNSLNVRVRDVTKAGVLAGQLLDMGANSLEGIEFDYSQKEAKYDSLRADAIRDALRKANSYVNGLGTNIRLGRVLEIATQPPETTPVGASPRMLGAAARQSAAVPVEPGVQTLRTEVQVTWELAQ